MQWRKKTSLKKKEKNSGVPPFSIHLPLLSGDLLCECISSASFHSSFIAFRFLIKATRAIEELGGPASKLSTVRFTRTVTKMKSEKTDKKQAPGAYKDAKVAAGVEASANNKRTTTEQPESEGECTDMLETHDEISRISSARNTSKTLTPCEYL